jgi:MoaA/NifB/PqqE/SkfB family radical SAM enzyme
MNSVFLSKAIAVVKRKLAAGVGSVLFDLDKTVRRMSLRPYELHIELTNLCNANCVFCPYEFQQRTVEYMPQEVFDKAVGDFVAANGGSVGLTPIVGDALIHPQFLDRVRQLRSHAAIDRIFLTTNAILIDRFGARQLLEAGLTAITISTASFDRANYITVYRTKAYQRMRRNVLALLEANEQLGRPATITVGFRTDRALADVIEDEDFQDIRAYDPPLDFTWSYTSAGGRVTRDRLPSGMKLRHVELKPELCVNLLNGPIVLPDGQVLGCSCVAAMDALDDLYIGNVMQNSLQDIYVGSRMNALRGQFDNDGAPLNATCKACDMYRGLELYRTGEGRYRAQLNLQRHEGEIISRSEHAGGAFKGG